MEQQKINAFRQFTRLISNFAGRDKFNKAIQYGSKTLWYNLSVEGGDKEVIARLKRLDSGISTARKADRLFTSLVDLQEVIDLLNEKNMNDALRVLAIVSALCSAYHWYTENVIFLSRINVLENVDTKAVGIKGAKFDGVGIAIGLFLLLLKNSNEQNDKKLHLNKVKCFGMICDLLHALDDTGVWEKMSGQPLNAGQYGMIGFMSSTATLYRVW
eukprot:CAMPEP_0202695242 /NCGR_PEP_ID=MMETSP1385-20130828/8885_1 /ASSEMBLY_ACC=CAM_ASM_000861 /TAXON_ID=933848 /ORGANISM="Elphidium margaritaceum" /LENGTH=214 /DNA_ID=CAMNT_0049351233 /DNA_START=37 /DNA_END=678 /DNA_ORIENTATION=+